MQLRNCLAAMVIAVLATAGIARADAYLIGKDGLRPSPHGVVPPRCSKHADYYRCDLRYGGKEVMQFMVRRHNQNEFCVIKLRNEGSTFAGDTWRAGPYYNTGHITCSVHQVSTNNILIYPGK